MKLPIDAVPIYGGSNVPFHWKLQFYELFTLDQFDNKIV